MRVFTFLLLFFTVLISACKHKRSKDSVVRVVDTLPESIVDTIEGMTDYRAVMSDLDQQFNLYKDSLKFDVDDIWYSLHIGHLFDKSCKHAVMHYFINDSLDKVVVLKQSNVRWDTVFTTFRNSIRENNGRWIGYFLFSDFDGDGVPDMKIVKDYWDIHTGERSDLWLYKQGALTPVSNFDKIVSAAYDNETHLIYSYQSDGCADMAMRFGVYTIEEDTVKEVKFVYCGCCDGDSCEIVVNDSLRYSVPLRKAYLHVPGYFARSVKEKCEM